MSSLSNVAYSADGRKGLDSVCLDAIIYGLGGPHFGAPAGPLFNIFRQLGHARLKRARVEFVFHQ